VNSRLTLNTGIRWDPYLPLYWKDGQMFHFDQKWFDQGIRSTIYKNAPAGVLYSGDPGVPNNGKVGPNEWANFSPRFGFALDPHGDGKTAIRASYGLFRDYPDFYKFHYTRKSPPWASTVNLQTPPGGFADPWQGYPGGSPYPVVVTKDISFPSNATYTNYPLGFEICVRAPVEPQCSEAGRCGLARVRKLHRQQRDSLAEQERGQSGGLYTRCQLRHCGQNLYAVFINSQHDATKEALPSKFGSGAVLRKPDHDRFRRHDELQRNVAHGSAPH
jgi:hypothetical protein